MTRVGPQGKSTRVRLDALAVQTACPTCDGSDWCVTSKGERADKLHPRRRRVIDRAYALGWNDHKARADLAMKARQ